MKADWTVCPYLILLILHQTSRSEMFQLLGPAGPVIAVVGEDVVLPAHLKPNISAEDMRIEWFRPQHRDPLVHLYLLGESRNEHQNPSYSGRAALFPEELRKGNTSLRLSRVQVSDEGLYWCHIQSKSDSQKNDRIMVSLEVRAVGTEPVIFREADEEGEVGLLCESKGWYPQPDLIWQDSEGYRLPIEKTEVLRDSLNLIALRAHIVLRKKCTSRFTCRVLQQNLNEEKVTEFNLHDEVSHDFPWKVAFAVTIPVLILIGIAVFVQCVFIRRLMEWKDKHKKVHKDKEEAKKRKGTADGKEDHKEQLSSSSSEEPREENRALCTAGLEMVNERVILKN